jgi:integrase
MGRKQLDAKCIRQPKGDPNGVFYAVWSEPKFSKAKGRTVMRQMRETSNTRNQKEAIGWFNGWLQGDQEKIDNQGRLTVGQAEAYYNEQHVDVHVVNPQGQKNTLARVCEFLDRDAFMDEVKTEDMTNYLKKRRKDPGVRRNSTMEDSSIWTEISTFKTCRAFALTNGLFKIKEGVVFNVKIPDTEPRTGDAAVLTRGEVERLMVAAQDHGKHDRRRLGSLYRWLAIAVATGRRTGAIETLEWTQVNFETGIINFLKPGQKETKKVKGAIPIDPWLRPILEIASKERLPDNPWVLDTPGRKYLAVVQLAAKLGLKHVHPHMLRHSYGTWKVQENANSFAVAQTMGVSEATAQKYYFHGSPEYQRKLVEKHALPEGFGKVRPGRPLLKVVKKA